MCSFTRPEVRWVQFGPKRLAMELEETITTPPSLLHSFLYSILICTGNQLER